jgi:type II secretory pathway predicted ATPase ExeA
VAGATAPEAVVPEDAALAIHGSAGGTPRLVNLLCDRVLQAVADAGRTTVSPADVEAVAGPPAQRPAGTWQRAS